MDDLYLKYLFTDRAGRSVFSVYNADDEDNETGFERNEILGQMRMKVGVDFVTSFDLTVDWTEAVGNPEEKVDELPTV